MMKNSKFKKILLKGTFLFADLSLTLLFLSIKLENRTVATIVKML